MLRKRILDTGRVRRITGGFSFIPHRFLADGFLASLEREEILLYLFLILASDRHGLSCYGYDAICTLLEINLDEYIAARDALIGKDLISFDGRIFQVLALAGPSGGQAKTGRSGRCRRGRTAHPGIPSGGRSEEDGTMIDRRCVFEIHRLRDAGYSVREIARQLRIGRTTVKKYLEHPERMITKRKRRASKLDPYEMRIDSFLEEFPDVKAPVVLQRLQKEGFDGRITILRCYLQKKRTERKRTREAFLRFESAPARQLQIDWGHFGTLSYGKAVRKLYALDVIESYSRMLYVEFTHSQKQETLHQGLLNAFHFFNGTTDEILVDNMLTAVTERTGSIIRFNDAFLDFLRVFKIVPRACNIRAPQEKGKIEKSIRLPPSELLAPAFLQRSRGRPATGESVAGRSLQCASPPDHGRSARRPFHRGRPETPAAAAAA